MLALFDEFHPKNNKKQTKEKKQKAYTETKIKRNV